MDSSSSNNEVFNKFDLPDTIAEFFPKEQYEQMCDLEKLHLKNVRLNYEMMLRCGLAVNKPDFMKPNRGIPRKLKESSSSESDEEWRPRKKTNSASKRWRPPYRPRHVSTTAGSKIPSATSTPRKEARGKKKPVKQTEVKEEPHVYSFRKRKETNYMKLEIPDDDEFLYCEECNQEHEGDCPVHGPLIPVDDTPVTAQRRSDPKRALKTLPPGLQVRESSIPNAGLGVFATKFFPVRSRFGPYEGGRVKDADTAHSSGYCWQICCDGRPSHFVDAKDSRFANWMRYVNCARTTAEQNVTAYQHCGQVYYRAHQDIQANTEILVWYGKEYGEDLGITRNDEERFKRRASVLHSDHSEGHLTDDLAFSDIRTSDLDFSSDDSRPDKRNKSKKHAKNSRTTDKKTAVCQRIDNSTDKKTAVYQRIDNSTDKKTAVCQRIDNSTAQSLQPIIYTPTLTPAVDRPYVCQHCPAAFVQFGSLKIHAAQIHRVKLQLSAFDHCRIDVFCRNDVIEKTISDASRRESDVNSKNNVRKTTDKDIYSESFTCDKCDRVFIQRDLLEIHSKVHINGKSKSHSSTLCEKSSDLRTHEQTHTGDKPYVCKVCGKAFSDNNALSRHKRTHTGDKPYVCKVCGKAFNDNGNFRTHERTHTGDKPYVCKVCGKAFSDNSHLRTHERTHTGDKPYVCKVCGKAFSDNSDLRKHERTHTGDKPYVCKVCGKAFNQSNDLRKHERTHTGDKPYVCKVCGKAFNQSQNLSTHERTHTGDKPYVCKVCGKAFSNNNDLRVHERTHTGDKPYVCKVCGKAFNRSGDLRTHERTHTGDKPYVCKVCGKAFNRSGDLRTHERTHTGDKPYVCKVCGKAFNRSGDLRTHERTHTGDKPYVCKVCGKAFSDNSDLRKHERTHTGDKPYVCKVCGKAFSDNSAFSRHERTHTGDKPYVCKVCGKAFSDNSALRKHERTHTGDRPYVCKVCGKAFSDNGNLRTHERTHTGDKPYVCKVCGKAFNQSNDLRKHERTHTGDRPYQCQHCDAAFTESGNLKKHVQRLHQ